MGKLLLVIDMQNDFIDGSLGTKEALAIVENAVKEIEQFEGNIIYTRDTHFDNYLDTTEGRKLPVPHCIKGTRGWELNDKINELSKASNSKIIDKLTFGSKDLPDIINELYPDGVDEIELIGLCTDICVISNALLLKAHFLNTEISVKASCCAGVTKESHENALNAMKMCHIDIIQ